MFTEFITHYYIDPIRYNQPYNIIETLTFALILVVALYAVYLWLRHERISVDEAFVLATIPYIALGALVRAVYDIHIITSDWQFLLVTPLVYFVIFAITVAVLIITRTLEARDVIAESLPWYRNIGIAAAVAVAAFLAYWGITNAALHPMVLLIIVAMAVIAALAVWTSMKYILKWEYANDPLFVILIFGHMLDAAATSYGISLSPVPYVEEHVLGGSLITLTGTGFVMFPLKLVVLYPAIYILHTYRKEIQSDFWHLLLLAMIIVGFGPGLRDMIQMILIG
jgi:uncharacterized membrane protein